MLGELRLAFASKPGRCIAPLEGYTCVVSNASALIPLAFQKRLYKVTEGFRL